MLEKNISSDNYIIKYPKNLFFLIFSYSMFVVMSNWYDSRIINFFGISVTPGALIYSITFLQSNILTEVYGFKNSRLAIFYALIFNCLFVIYGWIIMMMPSPENVNMQSFNDFLLTNLRITFASFISFSISEPFNSYLVSKLKIYFNGKYVGIRFIFSTLSSGLTDTFLFINIAFYGILSNSAILKLFFHVWIVKTIVEILFLPLAIRISKNLKKIEKLDIYDTDTKFTLFSLDTSYTQKNNKYN